MAELFTKPPKQAAQDTTTGAPVSTGAPSNKTELFTTPPTRPMTLGQQFRGYTAGALEEVLFGWDAFNVDEDPRLNPTVMGGMRMGGMIANQVGLAAVSYGVANAVGAGVKATKGVSWAYQLAQRSPAVARFLGLQTVQTAAKGAAVGGMVSGIQQVAAPEDRKPGLMGTATNMLMFAGGDAAQTLAHQVLTKYYPKIAPGLDHALGFLADNVGSTLAGLPVAVNDEEFVKEQFGAQMLGVALFDTLTYAISKGHFKRSSRIDELMLKADDALNQFAETGSSEAELRFHEAMNEVWEAAAPADAKGSKEGAEAWLDRLDNERMQEAKNRAEGLPVSDLAEVFKNSTEVLRTGRAIQDTTVASIQKLLETNGQMERLQQSLTNLGAKKLRFIGSAGPIAMFDGGDGRLYRIMDAKVPYKAPVATPSVLQPAHLVKMNDLVRIEVIENVDTKGISVADVEKVKAQLAKEGYEVPTLSAENVGKKADGTLVAFNVQGIRRVTPQATPPNTPVNPHTNEKTTAAMPLKETPENSVVKAVQETAAARAEVEEPVKAPEAEPVETPSAKAPEPPKEVAKDVKDTVKEAEAAIKAKEEEEVITPPKEAETAPPKEAETAKEAETVKDEDGIPHVKETEVKDPEFTRKDAEEEESRFRDSEGVIRNTESFDPFAWKPDARLGMIDRTLDLTAQIVRDNEFRDTKPAEGGSFNTYRLRNIDRQKQIVLDIANKLGTARTTFDEIDADARAALLRDKKGAEDMAEQYGVALDEGYKLLAAMNSLPQQMHEYKLLIESTARDVDRMAQKVDAGTATDYDTAVFLYQYGMLGELTNLSKKLGTKTAQGLVARRIMSGGRYVDFLELNPRELNAPEVVAKTESIVEAAGGKEKARELAKEVLEKKTLSEKAQAARDAQKRSSFLDAVVEFRQSSMLSGPHTPITNVVSQGFNSLNRHLTDLIASGLGAVRSATGLGGKDYLTATELAARVQGDITGFMGAFVNPVIKTRDIEGVEHLTGFTPLDTLWMMATGKADQVMKIIEDTQFTTRARVEGGKQINSAVKDYVDSVNMADWAKVLINKAYSYQQVASFGTLELGDRGFMWGAWQSEVNGQIIQIAQKQGVADMSAFAKEINDQVRLFRQAEMQAGKPLGDQALKALSELPPERLEMLKQIDEAAVANSQKMTWKDPLQNQTAAMLERTLQNSPLLRMFVPFYHTPVKILSKAFEYTPGLQALQRSWRDDLLAGGRRTDQALAKFVMGSALYGLGTWLVTEGFITPRARNEQERQQMLEAGKPELSIKIGERWYDYSKLDPAPAWFFQAAADFARIAHDPTVTQDGIDSVASAMIMALGKNAIDQSFLRSVNDIVTAIESGRGDRVWQNLVEPMVPMSGALKAAPQYQLGGLNPVYDPTMNETSTLIERYMPKYDRLDQFGKPLANWMNTLGMRYREETDSKIRQKIAQLGLNLAEQGKSLYGKIIPIEKQQEIMKNLADMGAEEALENMVSKDGFDRLDPDMQRSLITKVYGLYKKAAQVKALAGDSSQQQLLLESTKENLLKKLDSQDSKDTWAPWFGK